MLNKLTKELEELAERILEGSYKEEMDELVDQARDLYEQLLVLRHEMKEEVKESDPIPESNQNSDIVMGIVEEEIVEISESVSIKTEEEVPEETETEDEAPLSLNDLFVPTFDDIKEDMSQKDEFKDTVSLDETENLFQTKKEEYKQLSLNDRLVGSSIQVGLNDRIAFVNKLFNFSQSDFNKVLSKLNECKSKEEALSYFEYQVKPNYNWKGKEDLEERLVSLIERKYL